MIPPRLRKLVSPRRLSHHYMTRGAPTRWLEDEESIRKRTNIQELILLNNQTMKGANSTE